MVSGLCPKPNLPIFWSLFGWFPIFLYGHSPLPSQFIFLANIGPTMGKQNLWLAKCLVSVSFGLNQTYPEGNFSYAVSISSLTCHLHVEKPNQISPFSCSSSPTCWRWRKSASPKFIFLFLSSTCCRLLCLQPGLVHVYFLFVPAQSRPRLPAMPRVCKSSHQRHVHELALRSMISCLKIHFLYLKTVREAPTV